MRTVVITGGPDISVEFLRNEIVAGDYVICADSGVDYAMAAGIMPSRVVGDLDSISDEGKAFMDMRRIPLEVFPVEKDMTDTEIALRSIPKEDEILLVCSLSGRIDHVTANINLSMNLHSEGYNLTLTDGVSHIIPMYNDETIEINNISSNDITVSLVPYDSKVTGVTTEGLYYPLNDADILWGNTLAISNKLIDGGTSFKISTKSGKLGVFVVPTE